jgi:hypothetical protein
MAAAGSLDDEEQPVLAPLPTRAAAVATRHVRVSVRDRWRIASEGIT